jgi:hypothetical protein
VESKDSYVQPAERPLTLAESRPSDVLNHPDVIRGYLGGAELTKERMSAPVVPKP